MLKYFSVILISAAALAFSCSSQGEEEKIISFEVIHGGPYTSIADKREVVITNNADYQKLMGEVYSNLDQMPKIPDVDFTKNDVVGVFMGSKSNGGYSINVDKVIKRTDAVTVSVFETSAGKNCSVTEAITQPYEIVKVPKLNQKVKFLYKQRVKDCQ